MNITYSERHGDEVCVYVLGRLVMKWWLRTGAVAVFYSNLSSVQWFWR